MSPPLTAVEQRPRAVSYLYSHQQTQGGTGVSGAHFLNAPRTQGSFISMNGRIFIGMGSVGERREKTVQTEVGV